MIRGDLVERGRPARSRELKSLADSLAASSDTRSGKKETAFSISHDHSSVRVTAIPVSVTKTKPHSIAVQSIIRLHSARG